ncbi:MAG UNVERIFIED_CONTAM: hypothetical protein LVR29_24590 [Microcystis novacekii LVE1205-3]|jgi:anti-sigma-K factor RskA
MTARTRNQTDKKPQKKPKSGNKSQNWQVIEIWLRIIAYSAISITAVFAIALFATLPTDATGKTGRSAFGSRRKGGTRQSTARSI